MDHFELFTRMIWQWDGMVITDTVTTTWAIMVVLIIVSKSLTRHLRRRGPNTAQVVVEGLVGACENAVRAVAPQHYKAIFPFVTTLWIFLLVGNLLGLIPGLHSPTRDLSLTAALAVLVFLSVHWYGIRTQGLRNYLRHYLAPSPFLLPFHVLGELTRTVALAVRLFGNIMSMEMVAALLLLVAGFLVPVPILMLHVVEALVQCYIFGMLALIYIASGIQSHQIRNKTL